MTTIAWDGTTLAADQCSWSAGVRRRTHKVFRIQSPQHGGDCLVGFAGTQAYCQKVLVWLRGEGEKPDPSVYFKSDEMDRQCTLLIDKQRKIWTYNNDLQCYTFDEPIFATGAGQEFAWGALEAGATADRAIEIAIHRSDYAGFGVDVIRFD